MRATALKLSLALALLPAVAAPAASHSEIADLLANMTGALTDGNAAPFLSAFDRKKFAGYDKLESDIFALLKQGDISSSVEFLKDEGNDSHRDVELDWYLSIHSTAPGGPLTERRQAVSCAFEKQGRKWKIVALSPVSFFAPRIYR